MKIRSIVGVKELILGLYRYGMMKIKS